MKKYLILSLSALALTFTACGGNTEKKEAPATAVEASSAKAVSNAPVMTFDRTIHDFGTIKKVNVLKHFLHSPIQESPTWLLLMLVEAVVVLCQNTLKTRPLLLVQQDKFVLALILATNLTCNKNSYHFCQYRFRSRNHPYKSHGTS